MTTPGLTGNPTNSHGVPKDNKITQVSLGQVPPKIQDLGPDWEPEFPNYMKGTGGSHLYKVTGGFPSVHQQGLPKQVQFDEEGYELAPCGCLKRTAPPPPPNEPPFPVTPNNVDLIKQ